MTPVTTLSVAEGVDVKCSCQKQCVQLLSSVILTDQPGMALPELTHISESHVILCQRVLTSQVLGRPRQALLAAEAQLDSIRLLVASESWAQQSLGSASWLCVLLLGCPPLVMMAVGASI